MNISSSVSNGRTVIPSIFRQELNILDPLTAAHNGLEVRPVETLRVIVRF